MTVESQAGNVTLAVASGGGFINFLAQADVVISILVGLLSAVGILYSIIWHRVRIKNARKKENGKGQS